jgi:hypothetical protein
MLCALLLPQGTASASGLTSGGGKLGVATDTAGGGDASGSGDGCNATATRWGDALDEECGLSLEQLLGSYALLPRGAGDANGSEGVGPPALPPKGGGGSGDALQECEGRQVDGSNSTSLGGAARLEASGGSFLSAADLATACSRGPRAMGVLASVLRIAAAEAELNTELGGIEAALRLLRLRLSRGRMAGCLLLLNLGQLSGELEGAAAGALRRAAGAFGAPGVAARLAGVGALRARLAGCVRVSGARALAAPGCACVGLLGLMMSCSTKPCGATCTHTCRVFGLCSYAAKSQTWLPC